MLQSEGAWLLVTASVKCHCAFLALALQRGVVLPWINWLSRMCELCSTAVFPSYARVASSGWVSAQSHVLHFLCRPTLSSNTSICIEWAKCRPGSRQILGSRETSALYLDTSSIAKTKQLIQLVSEMLARAHSLTREFVIRCTNCRGK